MPDNRNVAALLEQAIGRRAEPDRPPGWTVELVIEQGLGRHVRVGGSQYVLRLDGRAAGPVFFVLTPDEFKRWQAVRESLGLDAGVVTARARRRT